MIQTSKLTKHFGELEVLKGIDLNISEKEIVSQEKWCRENHIITINWNS